MPCASDVASAHDVPVVIALLQRHLQGTHDFDLYCPRVASSDGVVSCTYHHWFIHAVADELHMVHECSALQPLRQQYAALFTRDTDTMRSFFAQQDHMQVFNFILDCLDFLNI